MSVGDDEWEETPPQPTTFQPPHRQNRDRDNNPREYTPRDRENNPRDRYVTPIIIHFPTYTNLFLYVKTPSESIDLFPITSN